MNNIIFLIVVIIAVVIKVLSSQSSRTKGNDENKSSNRLNAQVSPDNYPVREQHPIVKSAPAVSIAAKAAVQIDPSKESTTEFLARKAESDRQDDIRGRQEALQKERKANAGLQIGTRLYYGDSVPSDSRNTVCGYCGAENLIPERNSGIWQCYFCRERL